MPPEQSIIEAIADRLPNGTAPTDMDAIAAIFSQYGVEIDKSYAVPLRANPHYFYRGTASKDDWAHVQQLQYVRWVWPDLRFEPCGPTHRDFGSRPPKEY